MTDYLRQLQEDREREIDRLERRLLEIRDEVEQITKRMDQLARGAWPALTFGARAFSN